MSNEINTGQSLFDRLIEHFSTDRELIGSFDNESIAANREAAFEKFRNEGFPTTKVEHWRSTDLSKALSHDYLLNFKPAGQDVDITSIFQCNVPHFQTYLIAQLNGWYVYNDSPLTTLKNGVVVGSLAAAIKKYPAIFEKHYQKIAGEKSDALLDLNTAFAQDGIFIYVPDNVTVDETIQMVNVVNSEENIMLNTRNLIVLGDNSKLQLVHCDDSLSHSYSFINSITEIALGKNSVLEHYKLQNKDDHSTLLTGIYYKLAAAAELRTNIVSLNGGMIRNNTHVTLEGQGATAEVAGLYLVDKSQHISNQVFVEHAVANCSSNQLFKGVLDDQASAVFNGHVLVKPDAQQTAAYQSNKNILLTDKAIIDTQPFLEIYADDVKCSHGATVGQLDNEALFYIRSRGISDANARILLMYAFAAEVINKICIEELRIRMDDMVKKRLRGELSYCDQCVLSCSTQEKKVHFEIDMSKI